MFHFFLKLSKGTLDPHNYTQLNLQHKPIGEASLYWYNFNSVIYKNDQRLEYEVGLDLHD